jgi:PPOX class probable F420-dependent enzyme
VEGWVWEARAKNRMIRFHPDPAVWSGNVTSDGEPNVAATFGGGIIPAWTWDQLAEATARHALPWTNTVVTRDELIDFIKTRHQAIVITTRPDGRPQASPVSCGVEDAGRIVIATYPERAKTKNARRDPDHVSVLFLSDDFGGPWVQVDGTAEVLDAPEAVEPLVDYFRSISGEHPDWAEYRQAMLDQGKSLLRITPTHWSPIATGGFPARLA